MGIFEAKKHKFWPGRCSLLKNMDNKGGFSGRLDYRCIIQWCTCKMILSRAALPFILTLDEILFALRRPSHQRADWICPRLSDVRLGPPPLQDPTPARLLSDASFQIQRARENAKRVSLKLTLSRFGQTGFEPATPSPPDLYAKPLRHCPSLRPWTNI